jgi:hypothetical protein
VARNWTVKPLTTEVEIFDCLAELRGKRWYCRGQPKHYEHVLPTLDRDGRENLLRIEKLKLERESIDIFRTTARFFSGVGEENSLRDDNITLAVLRHYGVPTRLLDWTQSPHVAAYFAVSSPDTDDGEIWSFDARQYEAQGAEQWREWGNDWVKCVTSTEFMREEPPAWIFCMHYPDGFPRQIAQDSSYTLAARLGRDHTECMAKLLGGPSWHCRYVIPKELKPKLRDLLRDRHGIWRGSLFPDAAGAADTAGTVFCRAPRPADAGESGATRE